MLDSSHLKAFIERHAIAAEVIHLPVHTPTVEDAARAVGSEPQDIVKSLLFLVDEQPILVIACGQGHVDRRAIAAHFNVGRKRVKLADAETVAKVTGFPVGGLPPFGHQVPLLTFVDPRVLQRAAVFAGGGEVDTLIHLSPAEIARVTRAHELDLLAPSEEAPG